MGRAEKQKEYSRRYRERHPDRVAASRQRWLEANPEFYKDREAARKAQDPEKYRTRHFKARYGLTVERYNQMVAEQNGRCAICRSPPDKYGRLFVDHDHRSGCIRGLLCWRCNVVLGQMKDDAVIFRAAAEYLERSRS